jgi:hypothetical protein
MARITIEPSVEIALTLQHCFSLQDDDGSDTDALKDILPIGSDLLDTDLVNTIMNEEDEISKSDGASHKDELTDILSKHFNLDSMVGTGTGKS